MFARYTIFSVIIFFAIVEAYSQAEKIDSIQKILYKLNDTTKIDALNDLGYYYKPLNTDSARNYHALAYTEAKKINYYQGMINSLLMDSYTGPEDFPRIENAMRETIQLSRKVSNNGTLMFGYDRLGYALLGQCSFDEAARVLDTAYTMSKKVGDTALMLGTLQKSGLACRAGGNYEMAFEHINEGIKLATAGNNKMILAFELAQMGKYLEELEDYNTALDYYRQAFSRIDVKEYKEVDQHVFIDFALLFCKLKLYDSAKHYYNLLDTTNKRNLRFYLLSIPEYYYAQKDYASALSLSLRGLSLHEGSSDMNMIARAMLMNARIYQEQQDSVSSFEYAWKSLAIGKMVKSKLYVRDASQILYSLYNESNKTDSAFFYYRQYVSTNDSILTSQIKGRLAAAGLSQKVALLNKDKEIQEGKIQRVSLLKNILIAGILFVILLAFFIYRYILVRKRNEREKLKHELELQQFESQKAKAEFQQQATELEMQALRAQMNPHFIFNSLNSINRFILQNDRKQASEYLTKFSRLVRMILQNSQAPLISLESELESMELYLDLEALRFDHRFGYKISVPKEMDISVIKVPPLIIQPYAENAIWHGLMHKEERGQLDIEVTEEGENIYFKIADNGIGRKQSAALSSKSAKNHKSMGLKITAARIAMLQSLNEAESPVTINDLVHSDGTAAGTEVIIKMPALY